MECRHYSADERQIISEVVYVPEEITRTPLGVLGPPPAVQGCHLIALEVTSVTGADGA